MEVDPIRNFTFLSHLRETIRLCIRFVDRAGEARLKVMSDQTLGVHPAPQRLHSPLESTLRRPLSPYPILIFSYLGQLPHRVLIHSLRTH